MARTKHLTIYHAAYTFTKEIYQIKIKLPKNLKNDLGAEAFESSMKILNEESSKKKVSRVLPGTSEALAL
jgi:hypothetical protein